MAKSKKAKWILSSAAVLVIAGIVALSMGAQNPSSTPSARAVTAQGKPAMNVPNPALTKAGQTIIGKTVAAAESNSPSPEAVASYLEAYGWMVGQQAGFEMGFTPAEKDALLKGLASAASGEKAPPGMKEIFPKMQEYLSAKEKAYRAVVMAKMAEEAKGHIDEGNKYLAVIAKEPGVQKTADGLYYKIEEPGNNKKPGAEDIVTIHYTGKLVDGTVFDSSIDRGQPVDLPLYGVIPGFSEGLRMLGEGGKATLYIPSDLGYGNQAAGPIPPGSTLIFTVQLIKIQPKAAEPAKDAATADMTAKAATTK